MKIKKVVNGTILFDDFNTDILGEHWQCVPQDTLRVSLLSYPGYLALDHGDPDLLLLTNEPDEYVFELRNNYTPVNYENSAGIIVYRTNDESMLILEKMKLY